MGIKMLELNFYNVGDGDSALLSLKNPGKRDYNVLIDAGRDVLDCSEKSKRSLSISHLLNDHVDHIDVVIITHLHIDHMGGFLDILKAVPISRIIVPYIPKGKIAAFPKLTPEDPKAHKWPEFCRVLSLWSESLELAKKKGCLIENAWDLPIIEKDGLKIEQILSPNNFQKQRDFYDSLFGTNGEAKDNSSRILNPDWRDVSNSKNPDSTMQLITYSGKQILMCGDRYADSFEDWQGGECELVKIPHHGDPKSMTPKLLAALNPKLAIISCQINPRKDKDRPNEKIIEMLKANGISVFCTENKALPSLAESSHRKICIRLNEDGEFSQLVY